MRKEICISCAKKKDISEFPKRSPEIGGHIDKCRACCTKPTLQERLQRWNDHCARNGLTPEKVFIHPSDTMAAPQEFNGMPVAKLGVKA